MNTKQKRILIAMIVIILVMILYPPFQVVRKSSVLNMRYAWIFDPPKRASVNVSMLLIQWVGILILGGLTLLLAKTSSKAPLSSRVVTVGDQPNHAPHKPDLENQAVVEGESKRKAGPRGVRGWLLLLVVSMMVFTPLFGAVGIISDIETVEQKYPDIALIDQWKTYKTVTWWVFSLVAAISFYGGWGLGFRNEWPAVRRAQAILWITGPCATLVITAIPIMVFGDSDLVDAQSVGAFFGSFIGATIWTMYLESSKRVRNTYGTQGAIEAKGGKLRWWSV